jgi:hypothetical protein
VKGIRFRERSTLFAEVEGSETLVQSPPRGQLYFQAPEARQGDKRMSGSIERSGVVVLTTLHRAGLDGWGASPVAHRKRRQALGTGARGRARGSCRAAEVDGQRAVSGRVAQATTKQT